MKEGFPPTGQGFFRAIKSRQILQVFAENGGALIGKAIFEDSLYNVDQHPVDQQGRNTWNKRFANQAALEQSLDFADGVTLGLRGHHDERLEIAVLKAVAKNIRQHIAAADDKTGLVVPQPHAETGVENHIQSLA